MDIKIKPIFCRMGSKATLRNLIPKHFPKTFNKYVEAFVGGGAIFFYNDFKDKKVILNDLDNKLMLNYRRIKSGLSGDISKYDSNDLDYLKNIYNKKGGTTMDKFVRFILEGCNTFGGKGQGAPLYKNSNPAPKLKKLDLYKNKLSDVTLTSKDYKNVIKQNDGVNTFFYLDPPYEKSKRLYEKGVLDLEELRDIIKKIKGKFLLSINDSPYTRKLFNEFNVIYIDVKGQGRGNSDIGGDRKELLVKNYE